MRTTKSISITMPIAMLKEAERFAKRDNRTMSELVQEALQQYEASRRAKEERDDLEMVARIIEEVKKNPGTREEWLAEEKRLRRATKKYARPDLTDEDIVRMIHEMRGVSDA